MPTTTVDLPPEAEARLRHLAEETGQSKEALIREIIARGLEDVEDYYRAAAVVERIRRGEEEVLDDELWRDLDD